MTHLIIIIKALPKLVGCPIGGHKVRMRERFCQFPGKLHLADRGI